MRFERTDKDGRASGTGQVFTRRMTFALDPDTAGATMRMDDDHELHASRLVLDVTFPAGHDHPDQVTWIMIGHRVPADGSGERVAASLVGQGLEGFPPELRTIIEHMLCPHRGRTPGSSDSGPSGEP